MSINTLLEDARWNDGLYLNEKYEQYIRNGVFIDKNIDDIRIKEWLEKFFNDKEFLKKRIEADGMSYEGFCQIVNSTDLDYNFTNSEWYIELKEIFTNNYPNNINDFINLNEDEIPFFEFSVPFLKRTIHIIGEGINCEDSCIGKKRVIGLVLKVVMDKIFNLSVKTLIYELNKSRLNNELLGADSRQRYKDFVKKKIHNAEDILKILLEYPVLSRIITENVMKINQNILIVLERFIKDKIQIEDFFGIRLDKLEDIHYLGDSHNGGVCVLKLEFANKACVIYKPRDLSIDEGFNCLLEWFNQNGIEKKFKTVKSLNKKDYGWQEYVTYKECLDEKNVECFFERQGQYLVILYAINATDMHMENIISNGEHPVFVDLESLFHNQAFTYIEEKETNSALEKTAFILNDSILKTNMLPALDSNFLYHSDLSGLAGDIEQILNTYEIADKNTDIMSIKRSKIKVKRFNHLPTLGERIINPKNYMHCVRKGFDHCYNFICKNKQVFIKNIDKLFVGCTVRTIIRPTITYFTLLEASTHPKYLRSGIDRVLLLDYMWQILKHDPNRGQTIIHECYDLCNGDVPLFRTKIGEKYLVHHKDNKKIMGAYSKDVLSITIEKIKRMGEIDLNVQWEFIERTIQTKYLLEETYTMEKIKESVKANNLNDTYNCSSLKSQFLAEAERIGQYIRDIAIWGDDNQSVSWISMGMDDNENLVYKSTELGLYNGVTGIAYFYIYLGKETGNNEYLNIANLCINTALEMIQKNVEKNISVFSGYASLLYVFMHKAVVFEEKDIIEKSAKIIEILNELVDTDDHLDIISGCAGTLIVCIELHNLFHSKEALNLAKKCGEHIISRMQQKQTGVAWITSAVNKTPLSGIAHGNSGICLSLVKLYEATGEHKYLEACIAGIQYENSLYDPCENNWKDLRFSKDEGPGENYVMYWCNGAPGVGMARIGINRHYESEIIREDIRKALEKTMHYGFTEVSYSLCHGDMGNLELVMLGAEHLKEPRLEEFVTSMSGYIMEKVRNDKFHWKCGIPGRQQIPGLMLGLSGIGYQLLRLHNNKLPSVLLIEGPNRLSSLNDKKVSMEYCNV